MPVTSSLTPLSCLTANASGTEYTALFQTRAGLKMRAIFDQEHGAGIEADRQPMCAFLKNPEGHKIVDKRLSGAAIVSMRQVFCAVANDVASPPWVRQQARGALLKLLF